MEFPRRRFVHLAGLAAAVAVLSVTLSSHAAWSQATRTIKIVVPFAPGSGTDITPRLLAEEIGRAQGPAMVIENRAGAGSVIGTEAVARAKPDGTTLLINSSAFVVNPYLRRVNYEPLNTFEPICYLVTTALVIVVNHTSPYLTLADLLNAARVKPGGLTVASAGPATTTHIAFEMLKRTANVNMTFVPYPGGAPAVNALLGEHVTAVLTDYVSVVEQVNARKLRMLAATSRTRIEALPELPTVAESGFKDYVVDGWIGLFAPAKTPKETLAQLAGWFTAALHVPEVKSKLAAQGLFPVGVCGAEFGAYLRKQYDDYGRIIREANIKAE